MMYVTCTKKKKKKEKKREKKTDIVSSVQWKFHVVQTLWIWKRLPLAALLFNRVRRIEHLAGLCGSSEDPRFTVL